MFNDDTDFSFAKFIQEVDFEGVKFKKRIFFKRTGFEDIANFYKANFGKAHFIESIFLYKCLFKRANFISKVIFKEVIFHNRLRFDGAVISNEIKFEDSTFNHNVFFAVERCKYLNLSYSNIEKGFFMNHTPNDTYINVISLINTRFDSLAIIDWDFEKIRDMIISQKSTMKVKADQFVLLKEYYNKQGNYDDEDKAYVAYKRCMRKYNFPFEEELLTKENKTKNIIIDGLRHKKKVFSTYTK